MSMRISDAYVASNNRTNRRTSAAIGFLVVVLGLISACGPNSVSSQSSAPAVPQAAPAATADGTLEAGQVHLNEVYYVSPGSVKDDLASDQYVLVWGTPYSKSRTAEQSMKVTISGDGVIVCKAQADYDWPGADSPMGLKVGVFSDNC